MINLRPEDILHKSYINRLLIEIVDRPILAQQLAFKGGTCCSMLGYLDRFSVDVDFDTLSKDNEAAIRQEFHRAFGVLAFEVTRELEGALFFQLRYPNDPGKRNTLKVSASGIAPQANQYKVKYFPELDRLINSQTLETMVANKLVAVTDRYDQHHTIAGRDIYDIHHFLAHGYTYHAPVIRERTGLEAKIYLEKLVRFIKDNVTQKIINEDLNTLLPPAQFQQIRKVLIPETISLLTREAES